MKFALYDHAGKGTYLKQKLLAAGHTESDRVDELDLLILDCDWEWAHPRPAMIKAASAAGARIALYPHGGMPTVFTYDGLCEPDLLVDLRLEHGPGSIEIARIFGAELRQHAAGWLYSPSAPFSPRSDPGRVLFAPMHPNIENLQTRTNGHDPAPRLNQNIYRQLLNMGAEVTVSLVGPPDRNGVWPHPRAKLMVNPTMAFQASYSLVAAADTVIAAGTMGALAVALGKPTVMFGQGDWSDYVGGRYVTAAHAVDYTEMARYPIDCDDTPVDEALVRACEGDRAAAEWREAFVQDDGTAAAVRLLEELVGELLPEQANYGSANEEADMREDPEPTPDEPAPPDEGGEEQKNATVGGVTARAGAVA